MSKGPRALGLLEIGPGTNARLIPICIMVDRKFYDAEAYKASPVPMALEGGTIYEGMKTGSSAGLFTVRGVRQLKDTWQAEGSWLATGAKAPSTGIKAESQPREDEDKPPTLRHGSRPAPEPEKKAGTVATGAPARPSGSSTAAGKTPSTPPASEPVPAPPGESTPALEDPDRPKLRRGTPTPKPKGSSVTASASSQPSHKAATATKASSSAQSLDVQIIPAISDAGGPEPRPYTYQMKPEEEQTFRKKMLALAATELLDWAKESDQALPTATGESSNRAKRSTAKGMQPSFDDIKFKVFDVSTSNEPILVLTAKAHLRAGAVPTGKTTQDYYVTLVTHVDLYGELRKLLSAVTDDHHLDVTPRMELIDAVDADGDGRGELLFRQDFDSGTAYVVYRVGADQLWPLFQGTPAGQS